MFARFLPKCSAIVVSSLGGGAVVATLGAAVARAVLGFFLAVRLRASAVACFGPILTQIGQQQLAAALC